MNAGAEGIPAVIGNETRVYCKTVSFQSFFKKRTNLRIDGLFYLLIFILNGCGLEADAYQMKWNAINIGFVSLGNNKKYQL